MTTAQAGPRPAAMTDETIRQTVRALRSAHTVDALVLARALGISRQSLYNRLNGSAPFLAAEIAAVAQFFGCSVQDIYDGVVRITPPPPSPITSGVTVEYREGYRSCRPALRLVRDSRPGYHPVSAGYRSSPFAPGYAEYRPLSVASVMVNDAYPA